MIRWLDKKLFAFLLEKIYREDCQKEKKGSRSHMASWLAQIHSHVYIMHF